VQKDKSVCIWADNALEDFVNMHYLSSNFVCIEAQTELEYYQALASGKCSYALATAGSWEQSNGDASVSIGCSAQQIGPIIQNHDAGFAMKADP